MKHTRALTSLRSFALICLTISTVSLLAQTTPSNYARVISVDDDQQAVIENIGPELGITAIVISNGNPLPNHGCCSWQTFSNGPGIRPGETTKMQVDKGSTIGNISVAAIILEDGTVVGHAEDNLRKVDIISEILDYRKALAQEWMVWKNLANTITSDPKTLEVFKTKVNQSPSLPQKTGPEQAQNPYTQADFARRDVRAQIQTQFKDAEAMLSSGTHDQAWINANMFHDWIGSRADLAAKSVKGVN